MIAHFDKGPSDRPGFEARFDLIGWYGLRRVLRLRRSLGPSPPTLIDLGMGRGRDILYLARCGFRVYGLDTDPVALEKARRRARRLGVTIRARRADLRTVRLERLFDVVFSTCALNCLPRSIRPARFRHFQERTRPGGIHAVNAFLTESPPPGLRDRDPRDVPFRAGELLAMYRNWEFLEAAELRFRCASLGISHQHRLELVVARKPDGPEPPPLGARWRNMGPSPGLTVLPRRSIPARTS